ncbi:MAG: malto-oligosyltrehalose trehalohydrolase, partial [Spirochaetales bacterium]|nr:malto-oligosyltrehalose trehalohydrolase [Spirochaetales bacterium]
LLDGGGVRFSVWAPGRRSAEVEVQAAAWSAGRTSRAPLERGERGYWSATLPGLPAGARYQFFLDGETLRPDPASHFQPEGVHGPSEVVDHDAFVWKEDGWPGLPTEEMVLYELHVGTFTPAGTFQAAIARLPELAALGVSALELMPVAAFPGERNWGYDGVYPYAVQASYGGPEGLKELVAACHRQGLAVVLDVVYNHLGPEGNYLRDFGPYFTDRYRTPWGEALNFDGPWSDEVREYFIDSALHWFRRYHLDALRLDAIHAICDLSARPFLAELRERTAELSMILGRPLSLIAESDLNDSRFLRPAAAGGIGLHAQWSDDLHHALHALLTGEREGYYRDFGSFVDLVKAYRDRFVYDGRYSAHRKRRHGNPAADLPAERFVVFSQNHDQVGNRLFGERSSALLPFEALRLLAASVLLSPFLPLLFMGEEYGEPSPFLYFVSHTDPQLVEAVRRGRRQEFAAFDWSQEPPDPQDPVTREASVLSWKLRGRGRHRQLLALYTELIALRRRHPALRPGGTCAVEPAGPPGARVLALHRTASGASAEAATVILGFEPDPRSAEVPLSPGRWELLLDSQDERWAGESRGGSGLPSRIEVPKGKAVRLTLPGYAFALYERGEP